MGAKLSLYQSRKDSYRTVKKKHQSDSQQQATSVHPDSMKHVRDDSSRKTLSIGSLDSRSLPYGTLKGEDDRMNANQFALKALFEGNYLKTIGDNIDFGSTSTKVLDIGCGAGGWIMDMATEYPATEFIGVDKVHLFPQTIRPANVTFKQLDVSHGLPFENDTFDFVHIRLFLLAFNRTQWVRCLEEIWRVTKPGGFVQLMEVEMIDDGDEVVREFASQVERMMKLNDQDPRLCEKLGELLEKNGFKPVEEVKKSIPLDNHPLSDEFMFILNISFDTCKPLVIGLYNLTTEEHYQTIKRTWLESRRTSSNTTWFAAVGQKPA